MKERFKTDQEQVYRTGTTQQPKSSGGLVAILLVLVILFGGLTSVLGIMNIRLLKNSKKEQQQQEVPISFSQNEGDPSAKTIAQKAADDRVSSMLGLSVETVTPFLQEYYDLPQGVYITEVAVGRGAQKAGCLPGDIIIRANGFPLTDSQSLLELLSTCQRGESVMLTIHRSGKVYQISLAIARHN